MRLRSLSCSRRSEYDKSHCLFLLLGSSVFRPTLQRSVLSNRRGCPFPLRAKRTPNGHRSERLDCYSNSRSCEMHDRERIIRCKKTMFAAGPINLTARSEEHTSELQSLMRISYAVFCLKKKNK